MKGIEFDSRKVKPGYTFVAIRGQNFDGHDFIPEAIKNGAAEIIAQKAFPSGRWKLPKGVRYTKVADSRKALGELASKFYGKPSKKLKLIGVTGTKGKTTTCHLIYHLLTKLGKKTGIMTSVTMGGYHITSPDVITFHRLLRKMVDDGCKYGVIEVSSHAIDQKRIAGAKFDITVLTNIAPEHLDYHKTFEVYKKIKISFLNSGRVKVVSPKATTLDILPGVFNNINAETAVEVVEKLGFKRSDAVNALQSFELPQGRLEKIDNNKGINIYIDFAHTQDSLKEVLTYLKGITKKRLIAVFGCAGERDKLKRPKMGEIASHQADIIILTAEDPRSESVNEIIRQITSGIKNNTPVYVIPKREKAIKKALEIANQGDTVGLFGKGHERSMNLDGIHETPWSERRIVRKYLKEQ